MVSVVALLCAATMAQSDCSVDNAIDVIRLPDSGNEVGCLQDAIATLASLAIQPRAGEYWKIVCVRPERIEIEVTRRRHDFIQTHRGA
jgi:hypothetical protein